MRCSSPSIPDDAPLALTGAYTPHIDAAGIGTARYGGLARRNGICNYLLTIITDGQMSFATDTHTSDHRAPSAWFLPPNTPFITNFAQPSDLIWLHMSFHFVPAWLRFDHRSAFNLDLPGRSEHCQPAPEKLWGFTPPLTVNASHARRAANEFAAVVGRWYEREPLAQVDANLALSEWLHHWLRSEMPANHPGPDAPIVAAERLARRRHGADVSVSDMAAAAGMGRSAFTVAFQQARGATPGAFLRRLRLDEACVLLVSQPLPIAEIGGRVGYPSASSFGRAFRAAFGCTPKAYREQYGATATKTTDRPNPT